MNYDDRKNLATRHLTTYGRSRAVRWDRCDYSGDEIIHTTIRANGGTPFLNETLAEVVCSNVSFYSDKMSFRLFGHCLMPDHLHVLLSPNCGGRTLGDWLQAFKSFTTNRFIGLGGTPPLWQRSAHDHICREGETAESVLRYILENPVRAGLVDDWKKWKWSRCFIEL